MKCFKIKKLNNDGAALIFAIVIVMFVTILTTLLLYLAAMNYEMKTTDYRTRVSFYGAEEPLEELRMQLAVDTSEAAEAAYKYVMMNYVHMSDEDIRLIEFQNQFFEELEKIWSDRRGGLNDDASMVSAVSKALNDNAEYDILLQGEAEDAGLAYHIYLVPSVPGTVNTGTRLERDSLQARIFLRGISVTYTENNFVSQISTDFCIDVPELNWSVGSSLNPTGGVPAGEEIRTNVNFEECVTYLNWQKQ